jgi:hypothetical protein
LNFSNLSFIFSDASLSLVEAPVLAPGEVEIDAQQVASMQAELDDAANMPLEDDDDGF